MSSRRNGSDETRAARQPAPGAERWFFPAAALYGAVAVPLSVHAMLGGGLRLPGLAAPAGHAHELLFGYALAVVAGYLVGRTGALRLALLLALWLMARASYLMAPEGALAAILNVGFAGALAFTVAPKLIRAAKKLRNKLLGPLILAIGLAVAAFHAAPLAEMSLLRPVILRESVVLLALLMLFMGGRIIAPAVAGAIERAGGRLEARVQPRIEGALLAVMVVAAVSAPVPQGRWLAGGCLLLAGALVAVRLLRWRLWKCWQRSDLLCLGAGYAWLAAGLLMLGGAWLSGTHSVAAVHGITVGALGTLTTTVMARVYQIKSGRFPEGDGTLPLIALAMSAAAVARVAGGGTAAGLWLAAGFWSAGLLLLLSLFRSAAPRA